MFVPMEEEIYFGKGHDASLLSRDRINSTIYSFLTRHRVSFYYNYRCDLCSDTQTLL